VSRYAAKESRANIRAEQNRVAVHERIARNGDGTSPGVNAGVGEGGVGLGMAVNRDRTF
jgi:hypothetical protein